MQKILISIPDSIMLKLKALIPDRRRSKFISDLLEKELKKREHDLYNCALRVENDEALNAEMEDWEITVGDGIENESR